MTQRSFRVTTEYISFDPRLRRSWEQGGSWPHANLYYFYEAVVAAHFTLLGHHAIFDYVATRAADKRPVRDHFTRIMHHVVGAEASRYLTTEVDQILRAGAGQPDLFVFRQAAPQDHRVKYPDARLWFFVEVKGPGDRIRENQKRFWRAIAERPDIGLGPERIRVIRPYPEGSQPDELTIEY